MESTVDTKYLQVYARLGGFLYLFYIAALLPGIMIMSGFHVRGDFAQTATNIQAGELFYRTGLVLQLIGGMTAIPLGWAFYALLKHVDRNLALLALLWRVAESIFFGVLLILLFVRLNIYTARVVAFSPEQQQVLTGFLSSGREGSWSLAFIYFSIGSTIFFYLLLKSRFIPKALALLGLVGSPLVTLSGFAMLLAPDTIGIFKWWPWAPIGIAEIATGLLLLIRGADLRSWQQSRGHTISGNLGDTNLGDTAHLGDTPSRPSRGQHLGDMA